MPDNIADFTNVLREIEELKTVHAGVEADHRALATRVRELKKAKSLPEVQAQLDQLAAALDGTAKSFGDAIAAGTASADEEEPPPPDVAPPT